MTSEERREFEAHKKRAEQQLSEMYYGKNGGTGASGSLTMPPFLRGNENTHKAGKGAMPDSKAVSTTAPQKPNKPPKNRLNLLELLNFKNITMDNDRITILALCLLLSSEGADELLILALIYIML